MSNVLLKNVLFSPEPNGGVVATETKEVKEEDDKKEEVIETKEADKVEVKVEETKEQPKTITLTEEEFEERLKNKFIEGQRKASKGVTDPLPDDRLKSLEEENTQLKAEKMAGKLVDSRYAEDLVSMIKGKGLEVTESNFQEVLKKYPEWLKSNQANQETVVIGSTAGETNPGQPNAKEQARKLFGL